MADNVTLNAGTGGAVVAADDVSSVFYQRNKLDGGGDGVSVPVLAGGGVEASALRVTIASDSTGVLSVDDNGGSLTIDNAALTELASAIDTEVQVDVVGALPAGDNNIGNVDVASSALPTGAATEAKQDTAITSLAAIETAVEGTLAVSAASLPLPSGAATAANQTTIIGHVDGIEALLTTINGALTTGLSMFKSIDLDESEEEVKDTAGVVHFVAAFNTTAAPLFLKFYALDADDVTVGTQVPDITLVIPGNADSDGAGFILPIPPCGITFANAITVACTTGIADNDTGAPGANACAVVIGYK